MSLYTPAFPPAPALPRRRRVPLSQSSSGSSVIHPPSLSTYTKRLSDLHLRLATLPAELRPPSPHSATADPRAAAALRKQITSAVHLASHDPTSGKWVHVADMVRLGCTRGRYRGVHLVTPPAAAGTVPERQWFLAETDEEWLEWEAARAREHAVAAALPPLSDGAPLDTRPYTIREKVEKWQATVAPAPSSQLPGGAVSEMPPRRSPRIARNSPRRSLRLAASDNGSAKAASPSPLGFPVVKRSSQASKGKGKKKDVGPSRPVTSRFFRNVQDPNIAPPAPVEDVEESSSAAPKAVQPMSVSPERVLALAGSSQSTNHGQHKPRLDELPDEHFAFLPPSFPSQLQTSTPPVVGGSTTRLRIPSIPRASPTPILYSPPPFPQTQATHLPLSSPGHGRKRAAPNSPHGGPSGKRARRDSSAGTPPPSSSPVAAAGPSSKSTKSPPGLGNANGLPVPATPSRGINDSPHKDLRALLAASRRSRTRPRPPSRKTSSITPLRPFPATTNGKGKGVDPDRAIGRPRTPESSPARSHYFSSPASGSDSDGETPLRIRREPESPLFPLDFTRDAAAFAPQGVSTQPGAASQGPGMGMWNSQYDLEGNVDRVSAQLDKDVDFGAWLRDTPIEEDDDDGALAREAHNDYARGIGL
ncbi:hypothetical protein FA95DRAFT_88455 [Auriscalpium vulgare]|uniref:Uncharacterized protein n=1 Tax=Auriscalpium vulgare TaxID=40419 RepID=A0ACB8RP57_9AGAM|nr:hypothetical protein FA95DRAFT_88455 [Auriscalpium vulgare]